jgi:hypothetical protein
LELRVFHHRLYRLWYIQLSMLRVDPVRERLMLRSVLPGPLGFAPASPPRPGGDELHFPALDAQRAC